MNLVHLMEFASFVDKFTYLFLFNYQLYNMNETTNIKLEPLDTNEKPHSWSASGDDIEEHVKYNNSENAYDRLNNESLLSIGIIKEEYIPLQDQEQEPDYYIHKNEYDNIAQNYECLMCHKGYNTKSTLRLHIGAHWKSRYECTVCSRQFAFKCYLTRHMATHTGEKPHQCKICHKSFINKTSLTVHKRTHTELKPKCNVCLKTFATKTNLRVHMVLHSAEQLLDCNICHKRISTREHLTIHMRTHIWERPHQCEICNNRFTRMQYLKRHMRSHREKPYECSIGQKGYTQRSSLRTQQHNGTWNEGADNPTDTEVIYLPDIHIKDEPMSVKVEPEASPL